MPRHVRKGDLVQVIAGDDKGRQGVILRVITKDNRVVVQGVNLRRNHVRPLQNNPQAATVDREMPIHISNVQPVVNGKPTRVRFQTKDDGTKVRVAANGGQQIGQPLHKARKS